MKFNWGTGIALVYGLFALTMIAVVMRSRSYDPGLVQNDYYNLDLNYQAHYDKKQNTAHLKQPLVVRYDAARQAILLQFPTGIGTPAGSIKCFRSSTIKDDFRLKIKTDSDGTMGISTGQIMPGIWNLDIDWQANGTKYFNTVAVTVIRA